MTTTDHKTISTISTIKIDYVELATQIRMTLASNMHSEALD